MFTFNVIEILLFEGRSVLEPGFTEVPRSERVKYQSKLIIIISAYRSQSTIVSIKVTCVK